MATDRFRWGLIGPGRIAVKFAECLEAVEGAVLHGVASRNRERGKVFADRFHATHFYDSYVDLVADPEIDAIYIATPHRYHYEQSLLCLEAGKPVLCEKPLTVNAGEARRLIEVARDRQIFLMEALWTRFLPIYGVVRRWLNEMRIGRVMLVTSTFGFPTARNLQDRLLHAELAGGALLDRGIYNISMSEWVLGSSPRSFTAHAFLGETGVDELICVNLDYGQGVAAQFSCSMMVHCANEMLIYGTGGHIRVHPMFWDTTRATLFTSTEELTVEAAYRKNGFEYEVEEAMYRIRCGSIESPVIPHRQTLDQMELMDMIRERIGLRYPFE